MGVYAIKSEMAEVHAGLMAFAAQKTMYGGKHIAAGDTLYLFASENAGGRGLVARGVVTAAQPVPPRPGVARQTPRVNVCVDCKALARRRLGRAELKSFADWDDGLAQTELNFKFYRQATDKIVGVSAQAAAFLDGYFE